MPVPNVIANNLLSLGALAPVGPPPGGATAPAAPSGGARVAGSLTFTMRFQEETNWCWSAVAVSVAEFYSASTSWNSQCDLASSELGLSCCPAGSNASCNVPWYLDRALGKVGHYNTWASGSLSFDEIRAEIDVNRPVGVRIGWNVSGGHFVILSGYSRTAVGEVVTVEDPMYGNSTLLLSTFQTNYRHSGAWTHTYWTNP